MMKKTTASMAILMAALITQALPARAQDAAEPVGNRVMDRSFFFKSEDLDAIAKAEAGTLPVAAIPGGEAVLAALPPGYTLDAQGLPVAPPIRKLRLAGVLYRGPGDWIVWLNGKKIVPGNMPEELKDIDVQADRVTLKWLDAASNRILTIRLRPHQTYDIDLEMVIPG